MIRPLRLLGAALLCGVFCAAPISSFAQADPSALGTALKTLAQKKPDVLFEKKDILPPDFKAFLSSKEPKPELLTNKRVWELYEEFDAPRRRLGKFKDSLPPPVEKKDARGLRFLGLELGAGHDPLRDDNEPYLRKGVEQLLDWDVRARVDIQGLGARLHYRHPEELRSFSLGFLKLFDVPKTIGLDGTRDGIFSAVRATPEKPLGGFELVASGAMNQYLGGATTFSQKEAIKGDQWTDRQLFTMDGGYSPLGDNPGKPWNYTLLAGVRHENVSYRDPGRGTHLEGFGYSAGVAFQQALHKLPIPGLQPNPGPDSDFWLDRLKVQAGVTQSGVSSFAFTWAASVSFYVYKHLELTTGLNATLMPSPNPQFIDEQVLKLGAIIGVDLHF